MPRKEGLDKSTGNGPVSSYGWSWALRFIWLVFVGVLLFVLWNSLLRMLGVGVVLLPVVIVGLTMLYWLHRLSILWERWNTWLGILLFAAALLGVLAFFKLAGMGMHNPWVGWDEGMEASLRNTTLGGSFGEAVIGGRNLADSWHTVFGILRVVGLMILGTVLVAPNRVWQEVRNWLGKTKPLCKLVWQKAKNATGRTIAHWSENPPHERVLGWLKERRIPLISKAIQQRKPSEKKVWQSKAAKEPKIVSTEVPSATPGQWTLPSIELLAETVNVELSKADVEKRARLIEEALASYGVEAKVVQINVGPAVTQFGVEPGWDRKFKEVKEKDRYGNVRVRTEEVSRTRVKVERITSLANDLALALAAPSIRIEAPVPGKAIVGIEVPNTSTGLVSIREVLESPAFKRLSSRSSLAIALGKGTAGEMVVVDLAKMPHVLIAGATGSGKTVCLDSFIISLLMNNTPRELRFIMIDPKRVELIAFDGIPHLMTPVITENEKAAEILKWLTQEMDGRYRRLAQLRVHNIDAYNRSTKVPKPMPYIVVIVDELADLMMSKSDEIEPLLCRLAQMGRAVGIHCVVATQRPSVDVITGLIKANFPTRISFAVASQVDSRTILDTVGAEKLLGRGDMLYLSPELSKPKRLQGCFASHQEIERVTRFWSDQARAQPVEVLVYTGEQGDKDPLLEQAKLLAKEHKQISASFLQRQLRIGSARAEQLLKQLQEEETAKSNESPELNDSRKT